MDGQRRENIKIGAEVDIVLKADQRTGKLTHGKVAEILTSSTIHPRGIKVRLEDGQVGRVQVVYPAFPKINGQEYIEGLT
ncbi:MAG: YwbE family protein [bacterium]|nr:YwbE family protein [bacterium]